MVPPENQCQGGRDEEEEQDAQGSTGPGPRARQEPAYITMKGHSAESASTVLLAWPWD